MPLIIFRRLELYEEPLGHPIAEPLVFPGCYLCNQPADVLSFVKFCRGMSLQMLWGLINVIQMIFVLPLLNFVLPTNVVYFYFVIQKISSF